MSSQLREILALRRQLPTNQGCAACRGPEALCWPTAWEAQDGTVDYTGAPEFCPNCGRDIWSELASNSPAGQLHIPYMVGISAEDAP
jgi:hypothetical protein